LIYGEFDSSTRHFFVDPLLEAFADSEHELVEPRVEEIAAVIRENPPPLIAAWYRPPRAIQQQMGTRYLPSRLLPSSPERQGLWVERSLYPEFEASPMGQGTTSSGKESEGGMAFRRDGSP
jgi:hypothetical protein